MTGLNLDFLRESSICHVCKTCVLNSRVFCEICYTWLHIKYVKITHKHYNQLAKSPIPYYCQSCVSNVLPLTSATNYSLLLETFNSNSTKINNDTCLECTKIIGFDKSIKCKLVNHSFHLKCLPNKNHDLNRKIWSCNICLNFPLQSLECKELINEFKLTKVKTNKIKFDNDFAQFRHLPALDTNLNSSNDNDDNSINFNYYDLGNFLSITKQLQGNYISFLHTNIRSLSKNCENLDSLLTILKYNFDIIGVSETLDKPLVKPRWVPSF